MERAMAGMNQSDMNEHQQDDGGKKGKKDKKGKHDKKDDNTSGGTASSGIERGFQEDHMQMAQAMMGQRLLINII